MPTTLHTEYTARADEYRDSMELMLSAPTERPAIEWTRHIIEQSPTWLRVSLPPGWRTIGVRLAPTHAPDHVHGWPVVVDEPDHVVLAAPSRLGYDARLTVEVDDRTVRFRTLITHRGRFSPQLWIGLGLLHRALIPVMMRHAAADLERSTAA